MAEAASAPAGPPDRAPAAAATREEQVAELQAYYARHDATKTAGQVAAIIDKRRGQKPCLTPGQWLQLSAALGSKYAEPLVASSSPPPPPAQTTPLPGGDDAQGGGDAPGTGRGLAARLGAGAGLSSLKAARDATMSAAGAVADRTGVSSVADRTGLSAGLSASVNAAAAVGKAALSARVEPAPEPEPEPVSAEPTESSGDEGGGDAAVAAEQKAAREAELVAMDPAALAGLVLEREAELATAQAQARRTLRGVRREQEAATRAAAEREAAGAAALGEATHKAEVRAKRLQQLAKTVERQEAELGEWERTAEQSSASGQQRVDELEGEVGKLRDALTAAGAESAEALRAMQREVEASRAEHAQLQVEITELAAALAAAERSQTEWRTRAEAAEAAAAATPAEIAAGGGAAEPAVAPSPSAAAGEMEADQLAVVEGRVLRERCSTLEARARAAEQKAEQARRARETAEGAAQEAKAQLRDLEARHAEMVKAWVGAQPAADAKAAAEKAAAQETALGELEQRLQQKEAEAARLRSLLSTGLQAGEEEGGESGSVALSSTMLDIAKAQMEKQAFARVRELEAELSAAVSGVASARQELAEVQEAAVQKERRAEGVKAADGEYLKNIALAYIANTGDRKRLLPVLAELLQFSDADVEKITARSSSW